MGALELTYLSGVYPGFRHHVEPESDTHDTQIWKRAKFNPYSTEGEREDFSSTKFVAQEKEENKMATVAQVTMTTIA